MINIERIIQTDIPDIHPVYGGVRGRTLSSVKQEYAWQDIIDSGIHTIIDLREDGLINKRMRQLCEQFGMRYFYYPVDKHGTLIDEMIDRFDQLCRFIDEGGFYIACAMGLHRTDIALCTYWMFHAADKGTLPPTIYGYNQESGHTPDNIIRVLNAFYSRLSERSGKKPLPEDIFLQRKQTIKQLSRQKGDIDALRNKIIYVEMEGVLVNTRSAFSRLSDEIKKKYAGRFNEIPGIINLMNPTDGAMDAIHRIVENEHYDLYILTTPQWNTLTSCPDKIQWIQSHLGADFVSRLIFTQHKHLLKGDYLIDCSSKNGTKHFEGEWIQFCGSEFPDWESILNYLNVE